MWLWEQEHISSFNPYKKILCRLQKYFEKHLMSSGVKFSECDWPIGKSLIPSCSTPSAGSRTSIYKINIFSNYVPSKFCAIKSFTKFTVIIILFHGKTIYLGLVFIWKLINALICFASSISVKWGEKEKKFRLISDNKLIFDKKSRIKIFNFGNPYLSIEF